MPVGMQSFGCLAVLDNMKELQRCGTGWLKRNRLSPATSGLHWSTSQQRKEPLSWLFFFAARSGWKSGSRRPRVVHRGL